MPDVEPSQTDLTPTSWQQDIAKLVIDARRERLQVFDPHALTWLALVPSWTERLARACHFPDADALPIFLAQAEKGDLCIVHRATTTDTPAWRDVRAYVSLASYLPTDHRALALDAIRALPREWSNLRGQMLAQLAPHLPSSLLPEALTDARAIDDLASRATALLGLAPHLPVTDRGRVLREVEVTAERIPDTSARARVLTQLVPHLPYQAHLDIVGRVLKTLPSIPYDHERVQLLAELRPYVPAHLLSEATSAIETIRDPVSRVEALSVLAEDLPEPQRMNTLQQTAEATRAIEDDNDRTHALTTLTHALARSGAFDLLLTVTRWIRDDATRAALLGSVATSLPQPSFTQQVSQIADEVAPVVSRLVEMLHSREYVAFVPTALTRNVARSVSTLSSVIQNLTTAGLSRLVTHLATICQRELFRFSPTLQTVQAFGALAQAFTQMGARAQAAELSQRAAAAVETFSDPMDRCRNLLDLLPYVVSPWRERCVKIIRDSAQVLTHRDERIQVLTSLLRHLTAKERPAVLQDILTLLKRREQVDTFFWMPDAARQDVLTILAQTERSALPNVRHWQEAQLGATYLLNTVQKLGPQILDQQRAGLPVSPAVQRWAELAEQLATTGPERAAHWLEEKITTLAETGDTAQALDWVNTGDALAQALGNPLSAVVSVGNRRIALAYRRVYDERALAYFQTRDEQATAFDQWLQTDPTQAWALHYVGAGGVGKTMLLRHIVARLAPMRGYLTARVDFDHLSANYPVRQPGQLLLELATELHPYLRSTQQETIFFDLRSHVVTLHQHLREAPPVNQPLAHLKGPEFERVLDRFGALIQLLPQERGLILILDTTEELAKAPPVGMMVPNVEATFLVLERLQAQLARTDYAKQLRVIFAGRRLLAQAGSGWQAKRTAKQEGLALLPPRTYLMVHEMRGFTRTEALTFLEQKKQLNVSQELRNQILQYSPEVGARAPVRFKPARPTAGRRRRYHPFDLALLADWVREDPSLTPETIQEGGTDPYVELRIVRRITEPAVAALLPAVVMLRRFDREMLRPAFEATSHAAARGLATLADVFRDLANMEWLTYLLEDGHTLLEVDPHLWPRLRMYYAAPARQHDWDTTRAVLAPGLARLVGETPVRDLPVAYVLAALWVLPAAEAAGLWDDLTLRLARDRVDWARTETLARRALGELGLICATDLRQDEPDAIVAQTHPAWPLIQATLLAAQRHQAPPVEAAEAERMARLWTDIARCTAHPDLSSTARSWLMDRALYGQLAVTRWTTDHPDEALLTQFWARLDQFSALDIALVPIERLEQIAGAQCAALVALLEQAEPCRDTSLIPDAERICTWAECLGALALSTEVRAVASTLAGRAVALWQRWTDAIERFQQAEGLMTGSSSALASQPWADWHAPASLQDWVRLQQVVLPPQEVDRPDLARWVIWQGEALTRLHLIDAERLAAAILKRRLAHGMVPAEVLRELSTADHYDSNRRAVDYAHQVTPPLFSQVALGWLALGQGEQAFAVLNLWQSQAESQGKESSTVVIAKQAKIQVARRMRMDKQALSLVEQTTGARYPANAPDVWPLLALTLPPGEPSASEAQTLAPSLCHALSRSQPALTAEGVAQVRILRDALPDLDKIAPLDANAPVDDVSLALDRVEADLVVAGESAVGHMFARQLDPEAWLRSHPDQTEDGLRLMLRALTLNVWNTAPGQTGVARLQDWGARVGQRWLAALALDEGELLAMRLPAHAMHLLDHARHWFLQVDDHAGALIAVTRSAISAIHAQSVQAHAMASQIEPMYAQLVRRLTGSLLPAWPELLPRQVDQQSVFAAALYSDWGGWLNRLRLLQAWAAEPGPPGSRTALVENALRTIYGPRLPLEMDLTLTDQAKAGAPSDVSVRPIAAAAVASVNTARVEDTVFGLEITLASDSSIATQTLFTPIQVRIRLQEHARQWPGQGALAVRAEGLGAVAALQAYETAARDIPTAIVHTLHAVRQERGQRSLAIPLTVHAGVAALPWEALLTLAVAPPRVDDWEELFQFWRVSEVGMPVRAESVPAPVRPTVMSLGDRAWIRMVETGWSPLQGVYNMATSVSEAVRLLLRSPVTVLHLIGTPVRTASGLRLQVQGRSRAQQAIQTVEASVRGVDTLAGAESLLPGGVGLVVLQAEPAETTLRFDTEREYTADLRALAAEFFRAGAPAVIMLPALPSGLGMRALRQIASGLAAASATNVKPLLDAVSRTRAVIASHDRLPWETSFPGEEAPPEPMPLAKRLELALDVCLFIDSLP